MYRQEEFSPQRFVGRVSELEDLIRWATAATVRNRLRSIAAPPGYGKSWLLHQLKNRLSNRDDLFFIRIILEQSPSVHPLELRSRAEIMAWLPSVIETARAICPQVRDSDQSDSLEAMILHLVEDLCQNCSPTLRPILIVDGFGAPPGNVREMLEKHLLEQFWRNPCVRIIIALRDEFSLSSHNLRRGEKRMLLNVFTPAVGREQLQKRATSEEDPALLPKDLEEDILPLIRPYSWVNPGINTYLYETAKQNKLQHRFPLLTAEDLRNCWLLPIKKTLERLSLDQDTIEANLKAIVNQQDTWTLDTFAWTRACSRTDASRHIQDLMALSLVTTEKQRYKVVDGIREIIRAEIALRREEKL